MLGILSIAVLILDYFGTLKKLSIERNVIILLWRTQRGLNLVENLAQRKKFWKAFSDIGIVTSFFALIGSFLFLVLLIILIWEGKITTPAVVPVIPGLKIPGIEFYVPLVEGIIALATVLVAHELAHGIIARAENIKLKSLGTILFTLIPIGAFAEPDEEEQKKAPRRSRLRLFAVGSFANFIVAGIAFGFLNVAALTLFQPQVEVADVIKDSPAEGILQPGMIIYGINNQLVKDRTEFQNIMAKIQPGEKIVLSTNKGIYEITTTKNPKDPTRAFIGIQFSLFKKTVRDILGDQLPLTTIGILYWISLLNLGIGIVNMLPLKPLDGGLIFEESLREIHSRISRKISRPLSEKIIGNITVAMSLITLTLIVLSFIGPIMLQRP